MSTDRSVTNDLIETLEDGRKGFAAAADKLADSDRADLATTFRGYAGQRAEFSAELQKLASAYGDDTDDSGSAAAAVHRGWMSLKDAISGSDPKGVLEAAEQGEDHAVSEYRDALAKDISTDLRVVVERQYDAIDMAHDEVRRLRDTVS
jgi:uncharacterized protein (TIGR02284 family)